MGKTHAENVCVNAAYKVWVIESGANFFSLLSATEWAAGAFPACEFSFANLLHLPLLHFHICHRNRLIIGKNEFCFVFPEKNVILQFQKMTFEHEVLVKQSQKNVIMTFQYWRKGFSTNDYFSEKYSFIVNEQFLLFTSSQFLNREEYLNSKQNYY